MGVYPVADVCGFMPHDFVDADTVSMHGIKSCLKSVARLMWNMGTVAIGGADFLEDFLHFPYIHFASARGAQKVFRTSFHPGFNKWKDCGMNRDDTPGA